MTYYCGKCYRECKPEILTAVIYGFAESSVASDCCCDDVFTDTDREHPVQVIELPAADAWMEIAI
jgi:hypothetical protein